MAEVINIATFEFDSSRVEKSLENLQKLMFDIQKEQKRYSDRNKALQKEYNELDKQQIELKKRKEEESQAYKDIVSQMRAVERQQSGLFQSQKDLQIQSAKVREEYNKTVKVQKVLMTSTGELLTVNEAYEKALNREIKTKADAKASNSELIKLSDQLDPKIAEEAVLIERLNVKLDENTEFMRANSSATQQQRMNIGNYQDDIVSAANELN